MCTLYRYNKTPQTQAQIDQQDKMGLDVLNDLVAPTTQLTKLKECSYALAACNEIGGANKFT